MVALDRTIVAFSLLMGSFVPSLALGVQPAAQAHEQLIVEAEASRDAGEHAAAAMLYGRAFEGLSDDEQASLMGEILVRNATAEFQLASQAEVVDMEDRKARIELLRAEERLVRSFVTANVREQNEIPQDIAQAAVEIGPKISRLEDEIQTILDQERARLDREQAWLKNLQEAEMEVPTRGRDSNDDGLRRKRVSAALLGTGVVSVLGGGGMIAIGAWMFEDVTRRGNYYYLDAKDEVLDAMHGERTEEQIARDDERFDAFRAELEEYRGGSRVNATAFTVSGAVLVAAGIGLSTAGTVRLIRDRRSRPRQTSVTPAVHRGYLGISTRISF